MQDIYSHYVPTKGHLTIERLDKSGNVLDTPVDDCNMIMTPARLSMAEIFANLETCKFAHKFMFGTAGHKDDNVWTPKDSTYGFTKNRDRMFSQASFTTYGDGEIIEFLNRFDIVKIAQPDGKVKMWTYIGEDKTNYIIDQAEVDKGEWWKPIDKEPYYITIDFDLPRTNTPDDEFSSTDPDSPYKVRCTQQDTSVTFVIEIPMDAANDQHVNEPDYVIPTTVFTEGSLWVNDRIFSLKTFQGVTKDNSIKLRITWTITF